MDEDDNVFKTAGLMGGEKTHLLTVDEGPNHKHGVVAHSNSGNDYSSGVLGDLSYTYNTVLKGWMGNTGTSGGNKPHNNLQPYVTVYRWRRIK